MLCSLVSDECSRHPQLAAARSFDKRPCVVVVSLPMFLTCWGEVF
jgi:hypothetical protein